MGKGVVLRQPVLTPMVVDEAVITTNSSAEVSELVPFQPSHALACVPPHWRPPPSRSRLIPSRIDVTTRKVRSRGAAHNSPRSRSPVRSSPPHLPRSVAHSGAAAPRLSSMASSGVWARGAIEGTRCRARCPSASVSQLVRRLELSSVNHSA
ncbi:hypothetical protein FIBSPDRAFT_868405 [Athelia psychrophila]|uniref:Uncharacterized protein n=1 Tax=Athelia psychrophila TaxID=1759441 RepID=A0A166D4G0_9AGAM|nr:hypothetical protein FIBSPDRAFT_868405 [Fibularhizoctonia sp. CBS 109695]